mgnify:CR=1 FL=1|tara:strand:- start:8796 stop:9782 length:987 start_codon:yes stop_codon:yes gene_type:complete
MNEVILKYLLRDMSIEDQHKLSKWLVEDDANRQVLRKIESVWVDDPNRTSQIKSEIWDHVIKTELERKYNRPLQSGHTKQLDISVYFKLAAVVILTFFLSVFVYNSIDINEPVSNDIRYLEKISLNGQKINIQLPDGSKVKLNAGSKIIVPNKFVGETREVELIGEGFFEVHRDELHPFIVKTRGLDVKVLGTSFNVKAYEEDQDISVAVNTGKVAVNTTGQQELILYPDEMAVFNKLNQLTEKTQFNYKEVLSWKDKTLYFNQASFIEIIDQLEKWYGVEITIRKEVDSRKDFSGEYENKSLEVVLDGLSYVFDFKYEIKDDQVEIK